MKKFLAILILIFTLQTPSQADDIRDFQIEGMSIGDSALNYFSKSKIIKGKQNYYKNKKVSVSWIPTDSEKFSGVQFHWWKKDKKFQLIGISGIKRFSNNIDACYETQKIISDDISKMFNNVEKDSYKKKHEADPSGESTNKSIEYFFVNGDRIGISCYDWSKKMEDKYGYWDHLNLHLTTKELNDWLKIAY